MQPTLRSLISAGFTFCLAGALAAQQGEPANNLPGQPETAPAQLPSFPATSIAGSFGLSHLDGKLVGGGPDYDVQFGDNGVEFLPALPTANRLFPMGMRVTGYGRGDADIAPGAAVLTESGNVASYRRPGFVESYEVRKDGLKQNFTFSQLPSGTGDLVVEVAVDTDLDLSSQGDNGELTFLNGKNGGITIGQVIGIDANGARCNGSMSYANGSIAMSLPESFVSNAALPLVLDPLVGTAFSVSSAWDDSDQDIAYDAANNIYVVTWRRQFSTTSYGVRGQRVDDSGGLISGFFAIASATQSPSPRIANVATEDVFLCVWDTGGDVFARPIAASATSVVLGSQITVLANANVLVSSDVGGEMTFDNEAIVVWHDVTANEIQAKQVNVDGDVSPPTAAPFTTVVTVGTPSTGWTNSNPRISNTGGTTGNHCIVWMRQFTSNSNTTIRGALVNRNLTILDTLIGIANSPDGDNDLPAVDGDGRNWIVAWESEATPASGDNDVKARAIGWNPNASVGAQGFTLGSIVDVEAGLNDDERAAQVTWMGDSCLILHDDETGTNGDYDLYAQPVDIFTALDCDVRLFVDGTGGDQGPASAASKAGSGSGDDDALIVWQQRDLTTNDSETEGRRYRADDGINTNLGGGCGSEGGNYANCAMAGNSAFRARLRGSIPSAMAYLVISPARLDFDCGACTLVPDPFSGFIAPATTDTRGDASIGASIPSGAALVGATFYHQWLILNAGTPACSTFGTDLSDAFETIIQ